jgi:hypothetical protein
MDIFTYRCVNLKDFCDAVGWDYFETLDILLDSDISYGTNDDTLVRPDTLSKICEKDLPENFDYDLTISLGS